MLTISRQQKIYGRRASKDKKINWQSHPYPYPFAHHQIKHHQVHHIMLAVKENHYPNKNLIRNHPQVLEIIILIIHWSLMMIQIWEIWLVVIVLWTTTHYLSQQYCDSNNGNVSSGYGFLNSHTLPQCEYYIKFNNNDADLE